MGPERKTMLAGLALVALAARGCAEPTEITVLVTTDEPCDALTDVGIGAGPPGQATALSSTTSTCEGGKIGTLVVVPSGAKDDLVQVVVTAGLKPASAETCAPGNARCIFARRQLRFVRHTPLTLPIALRAACAGRVCPRPEDTCINGTCLPAAIDSAACRAGVCDDDHIVPPAGPPPGPLPPGPPPAPTTLFTTGTPATAMRISNGYLYWVENRSGHVMRGPLAGGAMELLFDSGAAPVSLAVGSDRLFFVEGPSVHVIPLPGSSVQIRKYTGTWNTLAAIELDPARGEVFVSDFGNPSGRITVLPQDLTSEADAYAGAQYANPLALAVDQHSLYYVESAGARIGDFPLDRSAPPDLLAGGQSSPLSVAVLGTNVYFTTTTDVGVIDRSTKQVTILAHGADPTSIVADASGVYFIERKAGNVARIAGGAVTLLATGVSFDQNLLFAHAIALDSAYVYYLSPGTNEIKRLPK